MRYKRSHLIGLFAALLVLVTILGGGILLVIKEDHASAGSTEGAAYHFQGTDQPQSTHSHKYHTNLNHKQTLILVNKDHALPKGYSVQLKTLKNGIQVAKVIYPHLRDMWFDCEAANPNYSINVVSGYRTRQKQTILLSEEIRKNERAGMSYRSAKKDALRSVAPADYSEHETGLCVDITASDHQQLDREQAQTPENRWLRKHCADYGFILRYPKHKEKVTGYMYESWHFRYVGKKAAKKIMREKITLEEYLQE